MMTPWVQDDKVKQLPTQCLLPWLPCHTSQGRGLAVTAPDSDPQRRLVQVSARDRRFPMHPGG